MPILQKRCSITKTHICFFGFGSTPGAQSLFLIPMLMDLLVGSEGLYVVPGNEAGTATYKLRPLVPVFSDPQVCVCVLWFLF